jgi:DNA-3-methyladenine glycosylase II
MLLAKTGCVRQMVPHMITSQNNLSPDRLAEAVERFCAREPRFIAVVERHGLPSLRPMAGGVEGLLLTVTEQFLSLKAAAVIWQRLHARLSPFSPQAILECPRSELQQLGLSAAKARSFHAIALAVQEQRFQPDALPDLDDDTVRTHLLSLVGVGPWTAEIYLLAALQRCDAWPAGDLALQLAAADLFGLASRPDAKAMMAVGAPFAPVRAVAARLLWSHYRGLKGMQQA